MTTQKEKPPAQVAGVQGFNAFTTPADEPKSTRQHIDWNRLNSLPPFGMFIDEKYGSRDNIIGRLVDRDQTLYQEYCDWHKAKGYWIGETPMGEIV